MEEEKKEIVIEIPGITPESEMGEKKKAPRPEFSPVPDIPEEQKEEPIIEIDDDGNLKTEESQTAPVEEQPKEEKKKKEKIKLNKLNSILVYFFIGVAVVLGIILLLQFNYADISKSMWLGINSTLNELMYGIMQHLPLLSEFGYYLLMIPYVILFIVNAVLLIKYKDDLEKKTKLENKLMPFFVVFGLIVVINAYFILSDATHKNINEIYMRDYLYTEYKDEDVQNLVDYFKNRIITYAESLNRKDGQIELEKTPYDMAVEDLKNISFKYEFLKGNYPTKIRSLSSFDLVTSGYPVGLTYNFTVGIDDAVLTDLEKIFTLAHELCHVKGIVRESDADYCAFLAGFNSNNDVSKYSMFVSLLPNLLYVMQDKEAAKKVEDELGAVCLESGYYEICNLYFKDLYRFTSGSDTLVLQTYSLSVYKDKKEELKQYLLGLKNRFNVSIMDSSNNSLSIDDANKLIDEGTEVSLKITGSINKDSYNKNISYLQTMADYFPHLYLSNSKDKPVEYPGYNYLKTFPVGNYSTLTEKDPEYSYDRAVRNILEYFSQYVFN